MRAPLLCLLLAACGTSSSGMSGPSISGRLGDDTEATPELQSNDIMARDHMFPKVVVRHILISWRDLAKNYEGSIDPRGAARSRADADKLAAATLARVRAGEDIAAIMKEISEDKGSAATGRSYDVTPDAKLVFEFKRLSLRLEIGEAGLVRTLYGWHVIKRIE